jgi:RHS repeat-associated protein
MQTSFSKLCFIVFSIFMLTTTLTTGNANAYSMSDVTNFMDAVNATPSNYGVDFTKGDKIYKEQYTSNGQSGYRVMVDKNSPVIKKFAGWVIVSQSACGYYWSNVVIGVEQYTTTYENGTTKTEQGSASVSCSREGTCNVFDIQNAIADPVHPGFGDCPGIGAIAQAVVNPCGRPAPSRPADVTLTPEPPQTLKDFFPVDNTCSLSVPTFTGTNTILNPASGGSIGFSANIVEESGQSVSWTLDVLGKTFTGSGNSVSATWDGKLADGTVVKPGSYSATLTATTADGQCTDSKTANFTVTPAPDGQCGLYVQFGSSAHLASGNLSHSQNLFSSQGGSLPLGLTLYYNSLDPANGALGRGWSHSYSYNLKENSDGSVLISEPNWRYRFYSPSGTGYSTQAGNYAVLAKDSTGFTLTEREGTVYRFNTSGQLASITDRNGNSQTFSYTGNNLTSMTDPAGHTATLGYDSANHLTTIVDQSGNSYTLAVGASLTTVTQPDNSTWQYSYDTNSFMLGKIDPLGNSTSYSYDEQQRVIGSTDPEGKSRSITYPQTSETIKNTTFTEKDGSSWSYSYDTQKGYLLSKTDPQSGTTSYQYDANGNRTSTTNPDGTATSSLYDNQGNLLSNTDAAGNTTSYTYNSFGQATSISDSQGGITRYSYDAKGNLTSLTDPAGATTSYQYDSKGNMTRLTDAAGQSTSFGYNAAGNMTSVTDASGATTNYSYDAAGNITAITDASGGVTSFSYDSRGRLIKTVNPQGNATSYSYDKNGNKLSATDANGNTTRYEYNSRNQLIKTTDALGNSTVYAYGSNACPSCGGGVDKLTALTDANNNVTRYDYDSLGRLMKETDPLGKITSYSYDTKGNLIARTDAKGQTISYSYDANGRLLKKSYPDNTEESFSYDAKGNILTAANKNIAYSFSYDVAGRMLSSSDSNGNTISYSYDAAGRKTHTVYPDGSKISYGYDTAGRLASITDQHNNRFSLTYTSLGQRAKLSYPNSSSAGYQYDSTGNLTNLSHQTHGRPVSTFSYTHDKVGNRLTRTELFRTTSYTYDSIYRLLTARINRRAAEQYSYDPVGNRLTGPEQQTDYSYGIGNQLLKQERTSYRYDDNGNLAEKGTSHSRHSHHCEHHNKPWNYRFDYENRLIEAENGNITVSFSYDPFGRRIEKKVEQSNRHGHHEHHGNAGEQTTRYLYDGQALIQETTTRGNHRAARPETVSYIHGPNIDEPLQGTSHNKTWYYHADGLGSIVALTDKHGNVVQRYDYDSFGNLQQQGESIEQPFTYTARELDEETGLYYYRARYYDPQVGRFISKDPIGLGDGPNVYAYVQSNPITQKDPSGLVKWHGTMAGGIVPVWRGTAGYFKFDLWSERMCGKSGNITVIAKGGGSGFGMPSLTAGEIEFDDGLSYFEPYRFSGTFSMTSANVGSVAVYGYTWVQLGTNFSTISIDPSLSIGFDFGVGGIKGSSVVTAVHYYNL